MWNETVVTIWPFSEIINRCDIKTQKVNHKLFSGKEILELDKIFDILTLVTTYDGDLRGIDGIVDIVNSLTSAKISSSIRKLRGIGKGVQSIAGKLGLIDAIFRIELNNESPSSNYKLYYDPRLRINFSSFSGRKYVSRLLRIATSDEYTFNMFMLQKYGFEFEREHRLIELINGKERIDLDSCEPTTIEGLTLMEYFDEKLGIGTNNKELYDRILPYVESKRKKGNRKNIPKSVKTLLWDQYYPDQLKGDCFVCQKEIDARHFEAGHVVPASEGGADTVDNLKPICRECNISMGSTNLIEFVERYHKSIKLEDNSIELFVSTLYVAKFTRSKVKDVKLAYSTWCSDKGKIKRPIKELDNYLIEKYEKTKDGVLYYSGISLEEPKGISEEEYKSLVPEIIRSTNIKKELQRRNVNIKNIHMFLQEDLPSEVKMTISNLI